MRNILFVFLFVSSTPKNTTMGPHPLETLISFNLSHWIILHGIDSQGTCLLVCTKPLHHHCKNDSLTHPKPCESHPYLSLFPKPTQNCGNLIYIIFVQMVPQFNQNCGNPITLLFSNHLIVTLDRCT